MSPDDVQTATEARTVHPKYAARMDRLTALSAALGVTGADLRLNDQTLEQIRRGLARIDKGKR